MARIFINYRRDDTAGVAGRLHDFLAQTLPRSDLFMDVDAMKPGVDFTKQIEAQVSQCNAMVALIGRHWLDAADDRAMKRLRSDKDYVRLEIASALKRDIPVIPVLVDGATMPSEDALPNDLKSLSRRHAMELRHTRFAADAEAIRTALQSTGPLRKAGSNWRLAWPIAFTGIAATALGFWLYPAAYHNLIAAATRSASDPPTKPIAAKTPAQTQSPQASADDARRRMEVAKRRIEELKAASARNPTPANTAAQPSTGTPPGRPGPTITALTVVLGDNFERVTKVYPTAADAGSGDLSMPLDGVRFFFGKEDKILRNIRVDAPFIGNVRGVRIGEPSSVVVAKLGQPSYIQGSSYFYRLDGNIIRFDINTQDKVETIFQILDRK